MVLILLEPKKEPLTQAQKAKAANKRATVEQQIVNTNYQRISCVNFEGERSHLAAFAYAMMRLTNQRDAGSVGKMPMRNGFSVKRKK